jgi:hypothetical protein
MKKGVIAGTVVLVGCLVLQAGAFEKKAFRFKEDLGTATLESCDLEYYYFIPCPEYSWFWGFYDWQGGDIIGEFFTIGDASMGGYTACDPGTCHDVAGLRFIDFAGYGVLYPGMFTVEFEIYCADESGCPVGPALWNSGPYETMKGWNDVIVDPPVVVTDCSTLPGPSSPRILFIARHTGTDATYPQWGFDNISEPLYDPSGCPMHDIGCLPVLYPRPQTSYYDMIHTGYYGIDFEYCPPYVFLDGADTTEDGSVYGLVELAWKVTLECNGPAVEPGTWGRLKSMYK